QAVGATPLVGESGHTGTSLSNYESTVSCDNGQTPASGTSITLNALAAGDKVTCTITNKRKPQVKLVKALVPTNDTGKFDFTIGAAGFDNAGAGFGNNGTTGFVNQAVGATPSVAGGVGNGTSPSDYASPLSCDNGRTRRG